MSDQFNIRALGQEDWKQFKAVRLEALGVHPDVYGAALADEEARDEKEWRDFLQIENAHFAALFDGKEAIGLNAVFPFRDDPADKTALLAMWYLKKEYRGQDLFVPLARFGIDWARAHGRFDRIIVCHRDGNEASKKANQKLGFHYTHTKDSEWPGGVTDKHHFYEIRF